MVLLSITPLLDGVLRRDIIAPFHTSGPPLLQFHLAIEQWGYVKSTKVTFPIQFNIIYTVLGNAHGSNNSNNDHYFLGSFSTTEASFYYSNMNFTGLSWIAIGSA